MSFKCHRDPVKNNSITIWTINAISTHPKYGTFSSAGSDGSFHFWDKEAKSRLKGYPNVGGAISATAFSAQGDIFAYAVSYDWHKGYAFNKPDYPNKVMLHPVVDDEVRPKKWRG
jgi:mRNA export factor